MSEQEAITATPHAPRILVVDDDPASRVLLEHFLVREGCQVFEADDGAKAVAAFPEVLPDMVLMDAMMPVMDGYEATRRIKALAAERFVPVIFLTAMSDDQSLAKCLECGGDDFITKPYSRVILRAKIAAFERLRGLYATIRAQRDELAHHENRLRREQQLAEQVFTNIARRGAIEEPNIHHLSMPAAISNGDILLVAERPTGAQHIMLGDFTGHGLSAALGALPVSDIFLAMTAHGADLSGIIGEINLKLREVLPTGLFLAACLVEFDPQLQTVRLWGGGVPDLIVRRSDGRLEHLPSEHLPLGIVDNKMLDVTPRMLEVARGDRLYLYSDGVIEARDPAGELFGLERLVAAIDREAGGYQEIVAALAAFRGDAPQDDDITLVELQCDGALLASR